IYVGGINFFGFIQFLPDGQREFISLHHPSDQKPAFQIEQICQIKDYVFFRSSERIFVRQLEDADWTDVIKNTHSQSFSLIFAQRDKIYAGLGQKGLFEIAQSQAGFQLKELANVPEKSLNLAIPLSKNLTLLSDQSHALFIFDGKEIRKFSFDNQSFIQKCQLSAGIRLSSSQIALGTRLGGVLILDESTRKTKEILNYQTNLGDDEIFCLGQDPQKGLWISHGQGISRADLQIPLRDFATYPGLKGKINTSYQQGDRLFVGTNQGLYYLKRVRTYQEAQSFLKDYTRKENPVVQVKVYEARKETKVGNLINEVFGKQKAEKVEVIKKPQAASLPYSPFPDPQTERLYILKSITYVFQKIPGVEGKVSLIFPGPGGILVASHVGLYSFINGQSQLILPNVKVNHYLNPSDKPGQYLLACDQGLYRIQLQDRYWERDHLYKSSGPLYDLEIHSASLWASGSQELYRWPLKDLSRPKTPFGVYPFNNPYQQQTELFREDNQLKLKTWNATYRFRFLLGMLLKDSKAKMDSLPKAFSKDIPKALQAYTALISDYRQLQMGQDRSLWLSEEAHLWRVSGHQDPKYPFRDSLKIHTIRNAQGKFYPIQKANIPYALKNLGLRFRLSHPFYLAAEQTLYQYRLENFQKEWTDFSPQPTISFSHLPAGSYTLHMRALNSRGELTPTLSQKFYIRPPFWQTWWFYALESLVLIALVFFSYYYSRSPRIQQWSQILTILTMITLFEFLIHLLEPTVEEVSGGVPVFKLLMNIILALSLHPAERWFKQWLNQSRAKTIQEEEPI
ncbi:MAG: triple tyrosine motif-containing protein, partial [Bacteroidota bacterium]